MLKFVRITSSFTRKVGRSQERTFPCRFQYKYIFCQSLEFEPDSSPAKRRRFIDTRVFLLHLQSSIFHLRLCGGREEDRREEREDTPDERFQHGSVRPENGHGLRFLTGIHTHGFVLRFRIRLQ